MYVYRPMRPTPVDRPTPRRVPDAMLGAMRSRMLKTALPPYKK